MAQNKNRFSKQRNGFQHVEARASKKITSSWWCQQQL